MKKSINMTKPSRFTLSGNNTICVLALIVTGLEHRKIEPTTKHHSLWRKTNQTWPKKADISESVQSYLIIQQIKPQKIQLISMNNLIYKVTIHNVPTNTPHITLDWSRSRTRTWYWRSKKREREPSSYYYGPVVPWWTTHASLRRQAWWCRSLRCQFPSLAGCREELQNPPKLGLAMAAGSDVFWKIWSDT